MNHAQFRLQPATGNMVAMANVSPNADPETLHVQPHEILLEQDRNLFKRTMSRSINDTEVLVLSALNGLKIKSTLHVQGNPEKTRRNVRGTLKFGGIAATQARYNPDHRVQNDQVFVTQFGGLCTIQNTGDASIKAGDYVVWDLPMHSSEGTVMCGKKQKQMVITRPYRPKSDHSQVLGRRLKDPSDPLYQAVKDAKGELGSGPDDIKKISAILHELGDVLNDERGRVFGRAMSNADKGETFDVLLGRYSA
jgi:hypothetical protein